VKKLPSQAIISGFKGKLDFYVHDGQSCARSWPRSPGKRRSLSVEAQWPAFRYAVQAWITLPEEIKNAYRKMAEGTGLTGRDMFSRSYLQTENPPPGLESEKQIIWRGGLALLDGFRERAGQRLTIANRKVFKLAFQLRKHGVVDGDVYYRIRKLDDTILLEKRWGNASELPTTYAWRQVEFDNPLVIDEEVRILVEFAGGDRNNVVYALYMNANVKPGEYWTFWRPEKGWYDGSGFDFTYRYSYLPGE
ncbi:unnamed protein product, partial [marine sediment metagenome]